MADKQIDWVLEAYLLDQAFGTEEIEAKMKAVTMNTFTKFDANDNKRTLACSRVYDARSSEPTRCPESASWWRDIDDKPYCSDCARDLGKPTVRIPIFG